MPYLCGVEGGATASKAIIIDEKGEPLAFVEGPHTNHWHIGIHECSRRIHDLIERAKLQANIPKATKMDSIGLALSGIDTPECCQSLEKTFMEKYSDITNHVHVCNDAVGSMAAASHKGGIVIIAGTGSVCKLVYEDYTFKRIGGLGCHLADEGSAYYISLLAIKTWIHHEDGLIDSGYNVTALKECILNHFQISSPLELMQIFFRKFDKAYIAQLCKRIASHGHDPLCQSIMEQAAYQLGRMVGTAVYVKQKSTTIPHRTSLQILCVGQVWKSWPLLEKQFIVGYKDRIASCKDKISLQLCTLTVNAAIGAAIFAARKSDVDIEIDLDDNISIFHEYNMP